MPDKNALTIFTLAALVLGGLFYILYPTPREYEAPAEENEEEQIFCTADAKICHDGSYVGRDSQNNCEFKPCPIPDGVKMEDGTILDNSL